MAQTEQQRRSMSLGGMTNLAVMAPIKPGMVTGFEPITYLKRLKKVLDALNASRQNVRESELWQPVFPDSIGQFGIIHHFRYAIVPPGPGPDGKLPADGWRLSLNVTFDGGWEPYMRVIFGEIGTLLDLLFCHSPDYPGSRTSSFETYCRWVRDNEIFGGTFFTDSGMPLDDHEYLARVERAQREGTKTEVDFARIALPSAVQRYQQALEQAGKDADTSLVLPLRTLKGLYRLSTYFPPNGAAGGDEAILRRFAQAVLKGPIELMKALDNCSNPPRIWQQAKLGLADELAWLDYPNVGDKDKELPQPWQHDQLQSHIYGSAEQMTHGCVVLLRITDAARARAYLQGRDQIEGLWQKTAKRPAADSADIGYLVAFTHAGLQRLGISQKRLDKLPQEFAEGMEARCGVLGDVRGNHPDRWARPRAYLQDASGQRVDMKTVHLLVQLRRADPDNKDELHPDFAPIVAGLNQADKGLRVLALQATRSYREGALTSGHFKFADGISQPRVKPVPAGTARRDIVTAGELLLGHPNARGDQPRQPVDLLLRDGSFLVVRKLRQHVDRWAALRPGTGTHQELLEKMIGRKADGTPLALPAGPPNGNDFDYSDGAASDACPFHSHIRRANPRDGRPYTPRILRRGMSYGLKGAQECGIVFMAYCASIAEQFETIQRWVAGGNSSGVGSAQADPILRVPQIGGDSTFRYLQKGCKTVGRAVLGDQPLVQLEWGLYLFVPALEALQQLESLRKDPLDGAPAAAAVAPPTELERVRQLLEDPDTAKEAWARVRNGAAPDLAAYGTLVGTAAEVLRVMKDDGRKYSVAGYRERMELSGGANLLGLDPGQDYAAQAPVKAALSAIGEKEAFETAYEVVRKLLGLVPPLPGMPGMPVRRPVDLLSFSDKVMEALCRLWVGLPDPKYMAGGGRLDGNPVPPRCPGNMMTVSRYLFPPHPRDDVAAAGKKQGAAARAAVRDWLKETRHEKLGKIAKDIQQRMGIAANPEGSESLSLILAGVMQGFTPTVQGNFFRTMENWIEHETLWEHQQALFETSPGTELSFEEANAALRRPLLATMRQRPVPDMMWRSPVTEKVLETGQKKWLPNTEAGQRVVLGITSALTHPDAPDELMFGRDDRAGAGPTVHGCPGYQMAMGVMLAMIGGLLKAGTLRPTGSPVLLILTPNK